MPNNNRDNGNKNGFLGPPTTVDVDFGLPMTDTMDSTTLLDDDFLAEEMETKNAPRRLDCAAVVNDERGWNKENNDDDDAPDIEGVIQSFNEELDNLAKSFDQLASSQQSLALTRITGLASQSNDIHTTPSHDPTINTRQSRHNTTSPYVNYSIARKYQSSTDPPSAGGASPLKFATGSTPQRGRSTRSATPNHHASDYGIGDNGVDTSGRSFRSTVHGTQDKGTQNHTPDPPRPVETPAATRVSPVATNRGAIERIPSQHHKTASDHQERETTTLHRMKQKLADQDARIQELERENADLRRRLRSATSDRDPPSPPTAQPNQQRKYSSYRDTDDDSIRRKTSEAYERRRHHHDETASQGMTFHSTSRREHEDSMVLPPSRRIDGIPQQDIEFTPGIKFVAELARLMKMENGHHAPLSVIIDKHWDRLKYHMKDEIPY